MVMDDLSDGMIRQINIELQKRKGMDTSEILTLTLQAMKACNKTHCHEIFVNPEIDEDEECIDFDISASNLIHAYQIQELFNMTVHMQSNGRKIIYSLLP
jgi:hypothetical protein